MADSEEVQRATALIEERLAQEEENEVGLGWGPKGFWGHPALLSREGRTRLPYLAGRKTGVLKSPAGAIPGCS